MYKTSDTGSRLLFKFRSGLHGLNEELGRHRAREGKVEYSLCGAECENVVHVMWEHPVYSSSWKLQRILGDRYTEFNSLSNLGKTSYVPGSEMWKEGLSYLLSVVIEFIVELLG